jgi:hypothetical protein
MNLYFESLLKEERKRTTWKVTKIRNFNELKKRRLIFGFPNESRIVWFNPENEYNYCLGLSIFSFSERDWNFVLGTTNKSRIYEEFESIVHLQSFLSDTTFKKKNLMLSFNTDIGFNIKSLV